MIFISAAVGKWLSRFANIYTKKGRQKSRCFLRNFSQFYALFGPLPCSTYNPGGYREVGRRLWRLTILGNFETVEILKRGDEKVGGDLGVGLEKLDRLGHSADCFGFRNDGFPLKIKV